MPTPAALPPRMATRFLSKRFQIDTTTNISSWGNQDEDGAPQSSQPCLPQPASLEGLEGISLFLEILEILEI